MVYQKNKKALRDLLIISVVALAVLAFGFVFEPFEAFAQWSRRHEARNLDEIIVVPVVLGFAFGAYSWRRWRDLNDEIIRRKELEEQLAHRASHDGLTGLPNRGLFMEHLHYALARASREKETVTVLFLDLDDFKAVNDGFGHEFGDRLLVEVARRLRGCLRPGDVVSRIGGDEFTVLLENADNLDEATRVARRIVESFETSFRLGDHAISMTASVGTALTSDTDESVDLLLHRADRAMYRAKRRGKARYETFAED